VYHAGSMILWCTIFCNYTKFCTIFVVFDKLFNTFASTVSGVLKLFVSMWPSWFVESFFVFRKKSLALRARHGFWLYTHQGRWRRGEGAVGGRRGGGTRVLGSGKGGRGPAASRGGGGAPAAARAWARVGAPRGVPRRGEREQGGSDGTQATRC